MAKKKSQTKIVNKVMEQVDLVFDSHGVPDFSADLQDHQGGLSHG